MSDFATMSTHLVMKGVKTSMHLADMGINMGLKQTMGLAAMMNPLSWANRYKVKLLNSLLKNLISMSYEKV